MEIINLLLFASYPFQIVSYYSFYSITNYSNTIIYNSYFIQLRWDESYLLYRNNRISSIINLPFFKFLVGDFIIIYGLGYLSGYVSDSLSIRYFYNPKIDISFYLSPSNSYQSLISRGFFINYKFLNENFFNISFSYDTYSEKYNFFTRLGFDQYSLLLLFSYYDKPHYIKAGDFTFENQFQIYLGSTFSIFDILKLAFETKVFFIDDSLYFLNWVILFNIANIFLFRAIHKEVYQTAQYYFSNGDFYQLMINVKPIYFGFSYRKYIYNQHNEIYNFELYLEEYEIIDKKIYFSGYLLIPYEKSSENSQNPNFSISSKIKLNKNIRFFFLFSDSLINIKSEINLSENNIIIFQIFENLDKKYSTSFSVSQISLYDSYDFYIPANSYGFGFYYFIYLNNLRVAMKVILSLSDNEINKIYCTFFIYTNV